MAKQNTLSLSQILECYRSSFHWLVEHIEVLRAFLLIFVVRVLSLLPSWLQYHAAAAELVGKKEMTFPGFLSVFTLSNPYNFLGLLLPYQWDYLFAGFLRSFFQGLLLFFLIRFHNGDLASLWLLLMVTSLMTLPFISLAEGVFLLWIKDKMKEKRATFQQLKQRSRVIFPSLFVTNMVLLALHLLPSSAMINPILMVQIASIAELPVLILYSVSVVVFSVIYALLFIVPFLIVSRERSGLKENFLYIRDFLKREWKNYGRMVGVFLLFAVGLNVFSNVSTVFSPTSYGELTWQLCLGVIIVFFLGTLVIRTMKFVTDRS